MNRRGLSLLEVILALAIFGIAMAALGELLRIGSRCSTQARELTTAQLYCESIMAEIASGIRTPDPIPTPVNVDWGDDRGSDPDWLYSVSLEPADQPNLVSVTVAVERAVRPPLRGTRYALTRWIVDPGIEFSSSEEESSSGSSTPASSSSAPSSNPSAASAAGGASG